MLSYGDQIETADCLTYRTIARSDNITFAGYWILRSNPENYQVYVLEDKEWIMYQDKFKIGEEEALRTWLELRYG
jgi:hypothetical protein